MAEPVETPFELRTRVSPRNHALGGGAHRRNLANSTEPPMCGVDANLLSNYFDHLFCVFVLVFLCVFYCVCLHICLCI